MIDFNAHAQLADATADLMRSCAVATAQTMTLSACRGLSLWSDLLRTARPTRRPAASNFFEAFWKTSSASWLPTGAQVWPEGWYWMSDPWSVLGWTRPAFASWPSVGNWASWHGWAGTSNLPTGSGSMTTAMPHAASQLPYATYRSAGGHAAAQVILLPETGSAIPVPTVGAAITQMQTVLGFWRAALTT